MQDRYLNLLRDSISDACFKVRIIEGKKVYPEEIALGKIWPSEAVSMIGLARLDNIREVLEKVFTDRVEGDFLEAGVWRGGACIFAKGVIDAYSEKRKVILADSFEGLPPPDPKYVHDRGAVWHLMTNLAVSEEQVRDNFQKFSLLDDQVVFLKGFFEDTLFSPSLPFEKLSVLRLDGDMYSSTIQTLQALYDKVSPGGFIIVDDYLSCPGCKRAVDDFRKERDITDEIVEIDWTGVFWRKI
ncbi:Macrocin O-methyltransferase [Brazilian cedratvirus IHUMI]|uniref:Macrocin O-methyltransferase n=1 Tax=Brazilian cedratvirus IHUMI TaxID=2126980 RepID=A0A2R8FDY2_9VIRU|nr:Macrocin O-methyltransferase [Brazilian cedratvirus IHUMI]